LFRSHYFCQKEDIKNFNLAETIPGPSTEALSKICKKLDVVVIASLFEKRASGLYHNTAAIINEKGESKEFIERCIFPMILLTSRNFISHLEIWI